MQMRAVWIAPAPRQAPIDAGLSIHAAAAAALSHVISSVELHHARLVHRLRPVLLVVVLAVGRVGGLAVRLERGVPAC